MYISWCIQYQQKHQFDDWNLIYQLLIEFANKMALNNNFNNYTSHIYFLIISAAHNCLLTYLNSESNINSNEILQILQNFYSLNFEFPSNAFDIIEIALNYTIHSNNSNTQNAKELYAYIGIICEEKKSSFPSSIAQKLADDLTLLFSQLDLPALTLYLHLSKHLSIDSNCQIFNLFGNSIWQIILQQDESFIKTKPNSTSDFTQDDENMLQIEDFNSTPAAEVAYRFYDQERFVNGVNLKTNFIFPDPISILDLLTDDLRTALDLISSIASNQEDLIFILFETLAGIAQSFSKEKKNENEEKHRWDINIVFLYFCKRFYKYIRKKECEILLSPPFFNPKKTVFDNIGEDFQFISSVRTIIMITLLNSPKGLIEIALYNWMNYPLLFAEIIHRIIANIIYNNKNNPSTYKIDPVNFNGFCRSLKVSSLHFQHLHYTIKDEKLIDFIEIARTSILLLISTLFTFPFEIVNMLWSNSYFVPFFLSFLFEVPLRSFILSSLLSYLSKQQNDVPKVLLNTLQQIMNICFPFFPNDKFVILITDITLTLNDAFLHQRSLTSKFQSFCSLFFDSFRSVIKTEPMKNYILQCIQFFSIVATLNELGSVQYAALDESILNAFENDIPQQLTNKLIQLIAGDSLASLNPTFIISHPRAVELFVHVSLNNTNKLVEVINFIQSLVEFSIINANLLRKSNFDIYLIDCIKNSKDKEIIDAFLNLFLQMAISVSSISVVQKYISLLSPFEGKYYSDFQEKYISTLNNIIVTSMKYPVGALKMNNHDGSVEIIGMNQNEFTNGFTFVCWVQLDAIQDAKYNPNLLFIQDSKGNKVSIFISAFNLYCKQATNEYESTGKAEFPIPKGRWSFISVTFSHNSDTSFMTPYYGTKEMKSLEYVVMNFQPGPMKCKIAGITRDSLHSSGYEARMSAFGLFPPLDKELLDSICQIGPRGAGYIPVKPICFFAPEADNSGFLTLKPRHLFSTQRSKFLRNEFQNGISLSSSSFAASSSFLLNSNKTDELAANSILEESSVISSSQSQFFDHNVYAIFVKNKNGNNNNSNNNNNNNNQITCDPTFSQLLMQNCKIDILLPLFDQFSMKMKNGNSFPNRKLTIDLFKNLLSSSIQVQKSFYKTKGINIISNLLYSNSLKNEEIIDYPLYLQFFSLTQIISYDPLIESIIKDILLDVELWMKADAENHLRIIRHWDRTLFPSMLSYVSDLFQRILYIMRVYYWYEYVIEEQELIKCKRRVRNEKLNVTECRQLLSSIAALISTQRFSKDDVNCIISHCLSCGELQQVIDLLMLIRNIGLTDPSPLSNLNHFSNNINISTIASSSSIDIINNNDHDKNEGSEFISFLYSLLPRRNHLIFILIFEVTIIFYKCQLIQTPCLQDQIMLFMDQLSPSKITPDLFFRGVESIKNGFYEMFPVCCWIAINESVTENHILLMLDQIEPSPNFVTHQTWSFWPIVLCFLGKSFLIPYRILVFIVSCDYKVWTHEYAMIHDVGIILNKESEKLKSLFLHCIAKTIEDNPNIQIDAISSFFYMAKKYLLFKRKEELNNRLLYLFKNESPFNEQQDEESQNQIENDSTEKITKNNSTEKLTKNNSTEKLTKNNSAEKLTKNNSTDKLTKNNSTEKLTKNNSTDKLTKNNSTERFTRNISTDKIISDEHEDDEDKNEEKSTNSVTYVEIEDESESIEENEEEIDSDNNFEYNINRRFNTNFDNYYNNTHKYDEYNQNIEDNDENNECIMVDDDLYESNNSSSSNFYYGGKKNNYIKSLSPRVIRSRTNYASPPVTFESAPIAIDSNSNKYSKTRNKSNDDNDTADNETSTHDLSLNMKINVNIRLKAILNKITYKNELDVFGVRFDEQGNMTDRELAEITIGIFGKFPLKSFLDFDLILCSFLLHRIPNVIIDHIKKLSTAITKGNLVTTFQSSIDLFIHHCSLMNITFDPPLFKQSSNHLKNSFTLLEKLSCSSPIDDNLITIAKHIFIIIKDEFSDLSIQKVAQNLSTQNLDDLINNNRSQILTSIDREKIIKRQNKHYWSHLWRSLEIDPAPWSVNLGFKTHFKRDTTACSFGCPFKLKRNWDFNDHKKKEGENGSNETEKNNDDDDDENLNFSEKLIEISFDYESSSNYDNKKTIYSIPCIIIKPTKSKPATFSLFKNRIELNLNNGSRLISIYLNEIGKIYFRNFKGKPTAFELFTLMKKSYFINFPNHKSILILKSIKSIGAPNSKFIQTANFNIFVNQVDKKVLWQHNRISNFEYLMHLNTVSGRTFNDISQYPIFPWIFCDMILKLNEQEEEEESNKEEVQKNQEKIAKLNELINDFIQKKNDFKIDSNSSILNSFKICDFLLRVEPFTSLFIKMQNNEFKDHDFMFKSIIESFSMSTSLDNNFCFLLPEFFYDFEFLKNSNKFEFGVNDVLLPEWTNQDHFYFIYMMRKALESDIVSQNLNQWIDIVWGSSQNKYDTFSSFKCFAPKTTTFENNNSNSINNSNRRPNFQRSRLPIAKPSSLNKLSVITRSTTSSFLNMNLCTDSENNEDEIEIGTDNDSGKEIMINDEANSSDKMIFRSFSFGLKGKNNLIDLKSAKSGSILDSSSSSSSNSFNSKLKPTKLTSFPPQLFLKPHPRRNVNEVISRPIKCVISIPPSKIKFVSLAEFENPREWSFKVVEIGKNGLAVSHVIDFSRRQQKQRAAFSSQPIMTNSSSAENATKTVAAANSSSKGKEMEGIELHFSTKEINSFKEIDVDIFARNNSASQIGSSMIAFVSHKTNKLFIVDPEKGNIEEVMSNVTGISTYKDFFAVSRSDEALSIYKGSFSQNNFMFDLSSFGDTIKCSCINKRFFVAIVGTRGGKLIVYSLNKGAIVNTIDLNGAQPFLVTVTKSWGFIVCYAKKVKNGILKHLLLVYSINGKLIRKVKINFEIVVWTSWTSNRSFDYMAVADKNGKLFAFEVFFCKLGETIHRCISRIVTMTYVQDLSCIATVTEDGSILFVPYETNS